MVVIILKVELNKTQILLLIVQKEVSQRDHILGFLNEFIKGNMPI